MKPLPSLRIPAANQHDNVHGSNGHENNAALSSTEAMRFEVQFQIDRSLSDSAYEGCLRIWRETKKWSLQFGDMAVSGNLGEYYHEGVLNLHTWEPVSAPPVSDLLPSFSSVELNKAYGINSDAKIIFELALEGYVGANLFITSDLKALTRRAKVLLLDRVWSSEVIAPLSAAEV